MAEFQPGMTSKQKMLVGFSILALYLYVGLSLAGLLRFGNGLEAAGGSDTRDLDITTVSGNCTAKPDPREVAGGDFLRVDSDDGKDYTITFTGESPLRGKPHTIYSSSSTTVRLGIPVGTTFPYTITSTSKDGCKPFNGTIGVIVKP